jgi:Flp pilus assembly protein TadB
MAQTKRKRRKKRRGTQAGTVVGPQKASATNKGRPATKEERKALASQRRHDRLSQPPSWTSALQRGGLAAVFFLAVAAFILKESLPTAAVLALFALVFYVPAAYYTDLWRYRRYTRAGSGSSPRAK